MAAASKSPIKSKVGARPIADFTNRIDANPPVCPLVHVDQDANGSFEGVVDLNSVLPLVERLIASATKEENEIDALCSAVIVRDLERAEEIADGLTKLRGAGKSPAPNHVRSRRVDGRKRECA